MVVFGLAACRQCEANYARECNGSNLSESEKNWFHRTRNVHCRLVTKPHMRAEECLQSAGQTAVRINKVEADTSV